MFESLSDKLEKAFKILKGKGTISEINVAQTMKEIRIFRSKRKQLKKKSKEARGMQKMMMIERRKMLLTHICQTKQHQKKKKAMEVAKRIKKRRWF